MMERLAKYFTLEADHKAQVIFLMIISSFVYLFNFHVNDIWTPNESFYAEAVREMFESGNFLDIHYNYEPRYNKPPLTYWVIAMSTSIFGLNEFGVRLPIVLMGIGTIWLTYLLGKRLYGEKGGVYALVMMALSLQMLAVKQYASPEMPLSFFFTLTMYWFIKGYQEERFKFILLFYLALGLTMLTKGYPYLIVIGGILGLFILWDTQLNLKKLLDKIKFLRLHVGIPVVLVMGLSWVIYMYLKDGQDFWTVYKRETFERALTRKTSGPKPFYYIEVISWSMLPYSLAFFYALVKWLAKPKELKKIAFAFSWFIVMLVIFTIAKGKLPTYMLQVHPGIVLMIIPLLLSPTPKAWGWRWLWNSTFLLPSILILGATFYIIFQLEVAAVFYAIPVAILGLLIYMALTRKRHNPSDLLAAAPFWSLFGFLVIFATYLPKLEDYRPYDEIGKIVTNHPEISPDTPILIHGWLIHNMPFYTERKAIRDATVEQLNSAETETLALVRDENLDKVEGFDLLWSGLIYNYGSESQFFKFIVAVNKAATGNPENFIKYHLVLKPAN